MKTNLLFHLVIALGMLAVTAGCIEDGISSSPSDQPVFSRDTVNLGDNFTLTPTTTARFLAYNRSDKVLSINSVSLRQDTPGTFRINVDGMAGETFRNVEIRPDDSIYIFVEATLPATGSGRLSEVKGYLDFLTNGVNSTVVLRAQGQDAERRKAYRVKGEGECWDATLPYIIFDSLVVDPGATLTLRPGTQLYFHDKAYMKVYGTLLAEGTADEPVSLTGDRRGNVVGNIPFDLMASQWEGLTFAADSRGSRLSHTTVCNTVSGIMADRGSDVTFHNCRLRNSAGSVLTASHATVTLTGCEVAEAAEHALDVTGGVTEATHCTFANYYLFVYPSLPIVNFSHTGAGNDDNDDSGLPAARALLSNCIIFGLPSVDFAPGVLDGTDITLRGCVLKNDGADDDNFLACKWATTPEWGVDRPSYVFDYRLLPSSPLHGTADAAFIPAGAEDDAAVDMTGALRRPSPTPGAYQSPLTDE